MKQQFATFFPNQYIHVYDELTETVERLKVLAIENDDQYEGLQWLYLVSDYDDLNTEFEPKTGVNINRIINADSSLIEENQDAIDE